MSPKVVTRVRALRLQCEAAWRAHCDADSAVDEVVVALFDMAAGGPGNSEAAEAIFAGYETKKVEADAALARFVETTQEIERLCLAGRGA